MLSAGGPPWLLSIAAAGLFARAGAWGEPWPERPERVTPLGALAAATVGTLWLLTVPPLLMTYAGSVPQGIACLFLSFILGTGVGRLLIPKRLCTGWSGSILLGLSGLLTLVALAEHPTVAQLALGFGSVGRLAPWIVLAVASAGTAGVAAGTSRADLTRPGYLAGGVVAGLVAASASFLGAPPDLPVRAAVGMACLAAILGLSIQAGPSAWAARFGWLACVLLVITVGWLPPLQLHSAALAAHTRVPARDLDLIDELQESEILRSGPGSAGPHGVLRSSRGVYLLRAHNIWPPGEAEQSAETLHGLLPVLAAGEPRQTAVIGLGRGDVLDPIGAANVDRLLLLDRSSDAIGQIAFLGGSPRDAVTSPAAQLVRSHPLPSLPLPRQAMDVIVVDLPQPSLPGARAWYGRGFASNVARHLTPDGWTAFRVHSRFLDAGDLARTIVDFSSVFPDATVWVDPVGGGDVILLGTPAGGLPDAQRMIHGLTRHTLRQALRAGDLQEPLDLFSKVFSRADSEVYREQARPGRACEWRAGRARLDAQARVPLTRLAEAAQPMDAMLNLDSMVGGDLERLRIAAASSQDFWPVYLQFLDALAQGDGVASMEQVDRVTERSGDPTRDLSPLVHQIVEGGRTAAARGQEDDAHAMFLLAAAFSPGDPEVNVELARLAWAGGNLHEAIERFDRALLAEPDNLVALLGAADSHIRLGEMSQALPLLEHAVAVHADSTDALYNLGRLYVDLGRVDDGLRQYRRALPAAPDNERVHFGVAEAHFRKAVVLRENGDDPTPELLDARKAADRALSLGREPITLCLKGQIELVSGNYSAAEKALRESVELEPDSFESRAALGETYFARHDYEAAFQQFQEAARLRPADKTVRERLQQLELVAGNSP